MPTCPTTLTIEQVVDDVAAVLDDAEVPDAVVYGTSPRQLPGGGMGCAIPAGWGAMILDSPLLNRDDIEIVRDELRRLLCTGAIRFSDRRPRCASWLNISGPLTAATRMAALYGIGGEGMLHPVCSTCCSTAGAAVRGPR